jgi:hypothetical protein
MTTLTYAIRFVGNMDEAVRFHAERIAQGVQGVQPPVNLHGQRIAKLKDGDGAEFSVNG